LQTDRGGPFIQLNEAIVMGKKKDKKNKKNKP